MPRLLHVGLAVLAVVAAAALSLVPKSDASKAPPLPKIVIPALPTTIGAIKSGDTLARSYLRKLDQFLADHPQLKPYRERIWNTAMLSRSGVLPAQLAGLIWCSVYSPTPCRLIHGVLS